MRVSATSNGIAGMARHQPGVDAARSVLVVDAVHGVQSRVGLWRKWSQRVLQTSQMRRP